MVIKFQFCLIGQEMLTAGAFWAKVTFLTPLFFQARMQMEQFAIGEIGSLLYGQSHPGWHPRTTATL